MMKKILLGLLLASTAMGAARIKNADIASDAAIVDTKLNTISTAGKVSNSATTAASANTASAIVARNASGAFYASTISADLVGAVTGNVSGNLTGAVTGNASTATAMAANPADCASNRYAISSDAQGNLGCDQVSLSAGVTGTLPVSNGGTGNASLTAYRILLSGTTSTGAIQVMSSEGTAGQVLTSGGPNTLPTFTTISTGSQASSSVWVHTANGYGSTNTNTPRFTTTQETVGSDITYADSSTLGATWTINTSGTYSCTGSWYNQSANPGCGFSLNQATGTQGINNIAATERLGISGTQNAGGGADEYCQASFTKTLSASDVIRFITVGQTAATAARSSVICARVE